MDKNYELIKKIHSSNQHYKLDEKCHIALFADWALEEDRLIFPNESTSYDRFIKGNELNKMKNYMESGLDDIYFSINSFRHARKREKDIWHLNAFALDFDFYKLKQFENYTAEEFVEEVKQVLPMVPTAYVNSGRGVYVIYTFESAPKLLIKAYKAIYQAFYKRLQQYGMDINATLTTQIIRVPGSLNSKTNTTVEVLEINETNYTLRDFFCLFELSGSAYTEEKIKRREDKAKRKEVDTMASRKFQTNLSKEIIKDLKKLIEMRNANNEHEGYRELLIYIARRRMKKARLSLSKELKVAHELNQLFNRPLTEKEFRATKPYGKTKCQSISRVIQKLSITEDEQALLSTLISKKQKDKYKAKRKRKLQLFGITKKQMERLQRQAEVYKLKEELHSNAHIARRLNISASMVTRDLQEIYANLWRFKKKLKENLELFMTCVDTQEYKRQTVFKRQQELKRWLHVARSVLA